MWTRDEDEVFEIEDAVVLQDSGAAILVESPMFDEPQWIPKRKVIHEDSEVWEDSEDGRGPGSLLIAGWFAEKKGWF